MKRKGQGSRSKLEPCQKWAQGPTKIKIRKVARTKWGVYSCPSLRIVENQEKGKDKKHTFCPKLL